jgi:hypothetical protein
MEKQQKEFNSKAQKIRRFKADIKAAGNMGNISFIDSPKVVRLGRQLRNNSADSKLSINNSINNKTLTIPERKTIVSVSRVSRKMNNALNKPKTAIRVIRRPVISVRLRG